MKKGKIGLMLGLAVLLIALSGCAPSGEEVLPEQESQVIEISTAEELLAAAERINESGYLQQNDTYLLTADIDLTGVEWTPIGFNKRVLTFQDEDDPERDPSGRASTAYLMVRDIQSLD